MSFEYPPKVIGGLGVYAAQLVEGLKDKGIDVLTITRGDRSEYDQKVVRILTPDVLYWRRFFFINEATNFFRRLNKSWRFDLVHLNGAYPITKRLRLPTVCTFHATNLAQFVSGFHSLNSIRTLEDQSSLLLRNPVGILSEILSARLSDKIICPSPSMAHELQSRYFVKGEKIQVIPNGFDLQTLMKGKVPDDSYLKKYGIDRGKFILFVGRLTHLKGVNYLIDAFRLVREEFRDVKLVIVGNGPSMPHLKSIARDLDDVLFIGQVTSPAIKKLFYESCFVVVVPSVQDSLPTVVLEAMVNKKPVIATNVGGNPFMVSNGENGFLVPPKDSKSLSESIKTLYQDSDLRKKMGTCGGKMAEDKFSFERMVNETLKVYESLL